VERKPQTKDLELKPEVERKPQTKDLELKPEVERKPQTKDLELKPEVETSEVRPTKKKKKEDGVKEQVEVEDSTRKESRNVAAADTDEVNKKQPEPKIVEKPRKKYTRKKKSVDKET
jgi:hypothetical protein